MYATRSVSGGCASLPGISQSRSAPLNRVRSAGGQLRFALGHVAHRAQRGVADLGEEPFAEPGARAQRHHEPHARLVDLAHRLGLPHRGVAHDQQAPARRSPSSRSSDAPTSVNSAAFPGSGRL